MTVIQVQIGKNFIDDVLLDGRFEVDIIIKGLCVQLGLSKHKLAPYNLHMAHQTIVKSLSLIKDLKIHVHGITYTITIIVIKNNVLNSTHSMFLGQPWLKDAKVAHNWGNNTIIIQETNIVRIIPLTKS
jgi:hypothetical protein